MGLVLAISLGGPSEPPPMRSISDPFKSVDYADLPSIKHVNARDGTPLAFRLYSSSGSIAKGSVVLVHGSSASSKSMHVMAKAFSAAGFAAYALDMRGHGNSGSKGDIAYVGQLEDDLQDFVRSAPIAQPATLVGFSSGGGFAMRFAGGPQQKLFANYVFLSPFISQDAPTYRPHSGGWVSVGLPRYIAIALLDGLGITAFNHLTVSRFAINTEAKNSLTPHYSFALAQNFRPYRDYRANIRAIQQPFSVLAGSDDEAFIASQFDAVFSAQGHAGAVTLLPGIGHIALTLAPNALQSAVLAVHGLHAKGV